MAKSVPFLKKIWTNAEMCAIIDRLKMKETEKAVKFFKYTVGAMGTNCYLAVNEESKEAAVIDPGADAEKILDAIKAKGCRVTSILLTHAHFDHILALEELREATGAPLYLHRDDAPLLADNDKNLLTRFSSENITFAPAQKLLTEGDRIPVGREFLTVLHTPGHTPGSICFLCVDTILSGDTLFRESIGRYDFPGGDYETIMRSVRRLAALYSPEHDYRLCPGHGPSTCLSYELENNLYLN